MNWNVCSGSDVLTTHPPPTQHECVQVVLRSDGTNPFIDANPWRKFMLCSGCGMEIPMAGSVCPYCNKDKSADVAWTVNSYVAVIVAVIGYFAAGFLGAIGGFVAGWAAASAFNRGRKPK